VSDEGRSIELPYHVIAMTQQPADDLDPYEAWAHDRLTPVLGPLRRIDRRGGPPALHDFEAGLADGSVAALEVTGEVDAQRLSLAASAERRLSSITVPNSEFLWLVGLAADARISAIKPGELRRLLDELEASGRRNAYNIGDYHDPSSRGSERSQSSRSTRSRRSRLRGQGNGAGGHLRRMGMGRDRH
jgi:hypothetical protein